MTPLSRVLGILIALFFTRAKFFPIKTKANYILSRQYHLLASTDQKGTDIIDHKAKLERLLQERERQRIEYLAADLAVKKFERTLVREKEKNNSSSPEPLLNIDTALGFTNTLSHMNMSSDSVPRSAFILARSNFLRELTNIRDIVFKVQNDQDNNETKEHKELRKKIKELKLSNDGVWKREYARPEVKAPWIIKLPYLFLCVLLDTLFIERPINRFYFLETVARMPYFSYITMIHAYETLGWWRRSTEAKRVHFAEEFNEYHHLLIMESLGGDKQWDVRFLAQHASIVYYFVLIFVWILSPTLAYNFSELIEAHAVDTYGEFLDSNQALLQSIAAPKVAKDYYESADMYIFDEFQTSRPKGTRRPRVETLYDVFSNIRDDEKEHVATMSACQDPEVLLRSPNTEAAIAASALSILLLSYLADEMSVEQLFSSLSTGTTNSALEGVLSNTDMAGTEGEMLEGMASSEQFIQAISGMGGALYKILGAVSKLLPIL